VFPVRYEHQYITKYSYLLKRPWRSAGVFPVRYEHHLPIKGMLSRQQAVEGHGYVSCKVPTSSTYKKVKLSP
jgi:hypothetical protein